MKDSVKLEWLGLELRKGACLVDFARKFREIFGEKTGADSQKAACLKLYREYAKIADKQGLTEEQQKTFYTMTCKIPPHELTDFERVWDPDAPKRCLDCNKGLGGAAHADQDFCDASCQNADKLISCRHCKLVSQVDVCSGVYVCTNPECRIAASSGSIAETVARATRMPVDTESGPGNKNSWKRTCSGVDALRLANNAWFFGMETSPGHVPAWTKRRRL